MAFFNSLEVRVVQEKLGLFCGLPGAEPQPRGLETAGEKSWRQTKDV